MEPKKILLVNDNPDERRRISTRLRACGHEVVETSLKTQAENLLIEPIRRGERRFDALVLGSEILKSFVEGERSPQNSLEIAIETFKKHPETKVIMHAGSASGDLAMEARNQGLSSVVTDIDGVFYELARLQFI